MFSLDVKYKIIKLIDKNIPFDQIVEQFKEDKLQFDEN